jgi:uncharacterized protein (TIGR03083 family)
MDYATYVNFVELEGRRLADVAAGNLSLPVPPCPGWDVRDVVAHVAEVYEHKIACTQLQQFPDPWPPEWPADRDPIEWLLDAHGRLLEMFAASGPDSPSATWWPPDQTVGFWARRMAQETAVHRADAESALGPPTAVDAALAIDGVDEVLVRMLEGDWSDMPDERATGQRVLVATGGSDWCVTLGEAWMRVTPRVETAHATIEGDPSDVLLWLWGRLPDERVQRSGDQPAIKLLRERLALATQ